MTKPSVTTYVLDLGFEDFHFRYLAKLLYDARFPLLRSLNLSKNRFSSRFMRDWSKSFTNYRFQCLEALDISGKTTSGMKVHRVASLMTYSLICVYSADVAMTDEDTQRFVACLEDVPTLLRLCVSHNVFSFEALAMLGQQIAKGSLRNLVELECSGESHIIKVRVLDLVAIEAPTLTN